MTCMPLSYEVYEFIQGHCIEVVAKSEDATVVLLNVYAPTGVVFLSIISNTLKGLKADDLLFLGSDFNCTEND